MVDDAELAVTLVEVGSEVAGRFFGTTLDVRYKSGGSPVSQADVEAESAMVRLLTSHRPGDGFVGEEGNRAAGGRYWLLDPVDGTENFVVDDPMWCTAVALMDDEGPLVAAVRHAASDTTFLAHRGHGAWRDGERLRMTHQHSDASTLATFVHRSAHELEVLKRALTCVTTVRMWGSGTLELAGLAAGRFDVWMQRDVAPWDWYPGALLIEEAGGVIVIGEVDGEPWHVACHPDMAPTILGAIGLVEPERHTSSS